MSGIFISYRRSDSPDATGRIYDRLVAEFGKAQVFKDVDSIPLGRDFRGHLNDIVGTCGVMLAIVGPHWTEARNPAGQQRLEDPDDFVRIELETALARDIPVVPVLVGHAPLPVAADLPGSLGSLVFRQSIAVRPDPDFHNDATRLVTALRAILDPEAAAAEQAAAALAQAAAARSAQRARRLGWMLASVAIVAAVLGITAALLAVPAIRYLRLTPAPAPPEIRTDIVTPATSEPDSFALSPDGRQIVFVASGDGTSRLWLRPLASTTAQPLAGTEGATDLFWSPDSRSIGFFVDGALKRLDLGGGGAVTLAPAPENFGGTWNAAGVILFAPSARSPLMRVSAAGGAAQTVTTLKAGQAVQGSPFFLPDGHHFLFEALGSAEAEGIYLGDLDGVAPTLLTNAPSVPVYLSTGWMLWGRVARSWPSGWMWGRLRLQVHRSRWPVACRQVEVSTPCPYRRRGWWLTGSVPPARGNSRGSTARAPHAAASVFRMALVHVSRPTADACWSRAQQRTARISGCWTASA